MYHHFNNNNNNIHFFNLQVANSPSRLRFEANLSMCYQLSMCAKNKYCIITIKICLK